MQSSSFATSAANKKEEDKNSHMHNIKQPNQIQNMHIKVSYIPAPFNPLCNVKLIIVNPNSLRPYHTTLGKIQALGSTCSPPLAKLRKTEHSYYRDRLMINEWRDQLKVGLDSMCWRKMFIFKHRKYTVIYKVNSLYSQQVQIA